MIRLRLFLFAAILVLANVLTAQTLVGSLQYGGVTRSYRVYIPSIYTPSTPTPLVFNLHGYTSNAFQQEFYSNMNAVADTANFIVCYPDGINNAWNSGFTPPYNGGVDDVGFISVLIDALKATYNIDLSRVYSCGMSNGGFMSYRLACDLEQRIAAIASVTGSMTTLQLNNCQASRPVPVLEIHGTNDPTVPYTTNQLSMGIDSVLRFWRNVNQCQANPVFDTLPDLVQEGSTVTSQLYGGCQASTEVMHFKIEGGGHTWPGAVFQIPGENTNQDIKASIEIWKFFYRFSHPAPIATSAIASENALAPKLYPNPNNGIFKLSGLQAGSTIEVIDAQGKLVFQGIASGNQLHIDLNGLTNGVYLVKTAFEDKVDSQKLMLSK